MENIKLFVATKAFISYNGKILILRESSQYVDGSNSGKYDIVGGRMQPGQRFDDSLRREVSEETGLTVTIEEAFFVNVCRPIVGGEQWQIVGIFFACVADSDKVVLSEDHDEFAWIDPARYKEYNLIDNLTPAFQAYADKLTKK